MPYKLKIIRTPHVVPIVAVLNYLTVNAYVSGTIFYFKHVC